ncbi:MAG: alkene reductase [Gemmatimonadaceae bacterium]|nr:alkene reductase [Gemmatimonadaceae bacterium]
MLFDSFTLGKLALRNRLVMAPMTRNRATADHVPTAIMATYYAQRASLGLIVTEGTAPSADGAGYARIPGLYNDAQVSAWKVVTDAVHAAGGHIFAQIMHTGRASHVDNLPPGARVVSSSATPLPDPVYTDSQALQPASPPHALTEAEIAAVVAEYADSARHAIAAGFDGIELHGANGYLIDQFLNGNHNTRTDGYGGSADNRNRFALDVAKATTAAIGADRVGFRMSPHGNFNGMGSFDGDDAQFIALATALGKLGLVYLHLVNHESMGNPPLPATLSAELKAAFGGTFIASGGLDAEKGEALLQSGAADLIAFGRAALATPDLVERLASEAPLNTPDFGTFYTPGEPGYTDYPVLAAT